MNALLDIAIISSLSPQACHPFQCFMRRQIIPQALLLCHECVFVGE